MMLQERGRSSGAIACASPSGRNLLHAAEFRGLLGEDESGTHGRKHITLQSLLRNTAPHWRIGGTVPLERRFASAGQAYSTYMCSAQRVQESAQYVGPPLGPSNPGPRNSQTLYMKS